MTSTREQDPRHLEKAQAMADFRDWLAQESAEMARRQGIPPTAELDGVTDGIALMVESLLRFKLDSGSTGVYEWDTADIERLLLDLTPEYQALDDPHGDEVPSCLETYLHFLYRTERFAPDSAPIADLNRAFDRAMPGYAERAEREGMFDLTTWMACRCRRRSARCSMIFR